MNALFITVENMPHERFFRVFLLSRVNQPGLEGRDSGGTIPMDVWRSVGLGCIGCDIADTRRDRLARRVFV